MAKQAAKAKPSPKKASPKEKKVLKRALSIPGVERFEAGTEVTADIEKAYKDFYKRVTGGEPIRPLDFYC